MNRIIIYLNLKPLKSLNGITVDTQYFRSDTVSISTVTLPYVKPPPETPELDSEAASKQGLVESQARLLGGPGWANSRPESTDS